MKRTRNPGFTLVELLTVVAIITLLISILVPAVNRARRNALEASIRAQHYSLSQGLEMFKGDYHYYPSSLPQDADGAELTDTNDDGDLRDQVVDATHVVQGAHRLAFALMGRDKLGCPAGAGADSISTTYYRTNTGTVVGPTDPDWGNPDMKVARRGPYISPEGYQTIEDQSVTTDGYVWLLCDKYNRTRDPVPSGATNYLDYSPILYYAANERGKGISRPNAKDDIYYYEDNRNITDGNFRDISGNSSVNSVDFWRFIQDASATVGGSLTDVPADGTPSATPLFRPHNPEGFILLSAGNDLIFGTEDDIFNWTVE